MKLANHMRTACVVLATAFFAHTQTARAQANTSNTDDPGIHVGWRDAQEPHRAAAERALIEYHLELRQLLGRREGAPAPSRRRLQALREAIALVAQDVPALTTAWIDLADIDFELRDGNAMLDHLERARGVVGNGPARSSVLFQIGIAYTMLDRFADARDAYRELLDLPLATVVRGEALCNLAEIETYLHAPDDSIAHYRACVTLLPGYDGGLWGLASALDREGREFEASEAAHEALSVDPTASSLTSPSVFYTPDYEVHYYLGLAREAQGRTREALTEWQLYLDAGGDHDAWARRAEAHVRALANALRRPRAR